jgi:hypothetical protein
MEVDGTVSIVGSMTTNRTPTEVTGQVLSGPAGITFDVLPGQLRYNFTVVGVYVIQIDVTDGVDIATDAIQIAVTARAVSPPVLTVGPNQTVNLAGGQAIATIPYSVVSDGAFSVDWSLEPGSPAGSTMVDTGTALVVTMTQPGLYVFTCIASNSAGQDEAQVSVTVPVPPPNPPVVTLLPASQIVQIPDPAVLNYTIVSANLTTRSWTVESGPPGATFTDPGTGRVEFTFAAGGDYVIRLTATDPLSGPGFAEAAVTAIFPDASLVVATPLTTGSKRNQSSSPNVASTNPVTIPANALALLWVTANDTRGGPPVITDASGRVWELVAAEAVLRGIFVYRSQLPVPTTSGVGITSPAGGAGERNDLVWQINMHQGLNQGGINGSGAIQQIASKNHITSGEGPVLGTSVPFPMQPLLNCAVAAGFAMNDVALPAFPGVGYTLLGVAPLVNLTMQTESRPDFADVADMTWTNLSHYICIALELRRP